jgi:hypothetical protein
VFSRRRRPHPVTLRSELRARRLPNRQLDLGPMSALVESCRSDRPVSMSALAVCSPKAAGPLPASSGRSEHVCFSRRPPETGQSAFHPKRSFKDPLPTDQPRCQPRITGWRSSPSGVKPRYSTVAITACPTSRAARIWRTSATLSPEPAEPGEEFAFHEASEP